MLRDVVLQTKVVERRLPAALHLPIFYGTVLLFIGTVIVVVYEDILHWFGDFVLGGLFYVVFEAVLDLAGLALVIGIGIAMWRRFVMKPEYITSRLSTNVVLAGLLFMGLSGFGLEAYRIAAQPNEWAAAAFVGWSLSHLMGGVSDGSAVAVYQVFWWLHAAAAFSLIVGLAWTGLSHVLLVPATVAAHDPERPRTKLTTPFDLIAATESEEDVELVAGTALTSDIAGARAPGGRRVRLVRPVSRRMPRERGGTRAFAARPRAGHPAVAGHWSWDRGGRTPGRRLRAGRVVVYELLRLRGGVPRPYPARRLHPGLPPRAGGPESPRRAEAEHAPGSGPQSEPVQTAVSRARRLAHGGAIRRGGDLRGGRAQGAARVPLLDRLQRRLRRAFEPGGASDHGPATRRRRELHHLGAGGAMLRRAGQAAGRGGPLPDARHDGDRDDQGDTGRARSSRSARTASASSFTSTRHSASPSRRCITRSSSPTW